MSGHYVLDAGASPNNCHRDKSAALARDLFRVLLLRAGGGRAPRCRRVRSTRISSCNVSCAADDEMAAIVLTEPAMKILLLVLVCAVPAGAQSRVYTNADLTPKPVTAWTRTVTPAELEGLRQHQYQYQAPPPPTSGPSVFVFGSSPTEGPYGAFSPMPPPRRLDGTAYTDPPWEYVAYVGPSYVGRSYGSRSHAPASAPRAAHRRR